MTLDSSLRIALVTVEYPPDRGSYGLGTYTQALATALAERGHQIHVLARSPQGDQLEPLGKITVHRLGPARLEVGSRIGPLQLAAAASRGLGREWLYRRKLAQRLERLIATEGIQLIEAADATAEALFYQPERYPHIPFIVKLHGPFAVAELYDKNVPEAVRQAIRAVERRQLLRATHLTAPSGIAAEVFRREMGLTAPITVLPNPPSFGSASIPNACKPDPNLVLFIGRITPAKGIQLLMDAIPDVLEQRSDTLFLIVGGDAVSDERFEASKAKLLVRLPKHFHSAVTFLGRQPHAEVARLLGRATLCVFPSLFDNFPYTCLEAMSYGKAIIGSRNSGMAEMLEGGAGVLITPGKDSLAEAVLEQLENPALRQTLGQRARLRSETVFSEKAVLDATEAFYRRAVGERARLALSRRGTVR